MRQSNDEKLYHQYCELLAYCEVGFMNGYTDDRGSCSQKIGLHLKPIIIANTLVIPYPVYGRNSDLKPNHCERKGV